MKITLLTILFLTATALAANEFIQKVAPDTQSGVYESGISAADTATVTLVTAAPILPLNNNQKLAVDVRFTTSGANTCKITMVRGFLVGGKLDPRSVTTLTATSNNSFKDAAGNYFADDLVFDTEGFPYCMLLCGAPSAGNVNLSTSRY